jgi:2-hydroxychromene-2-carboxylate isomerase
MDARRWANKRGGFMIKGPPKIYDSRPALIGGLFAQRQGNLRRYSDLVFEGFFARTLEIDRAEQVAAVVEKLGLSPEEYRRFLEGDGARELDACLSEADADQVFGVPTFVFRGELFWGYDRLPLLEERLMAAGLAKRR